MTTITITVETFDEPTDAADGRPELTWGKLRELVNLHTPAAVDLLVRHPFSSDAIVGENVWGTITVTQALSDADIVRDALKFGSALIVDTDPGIIVLAGEELKQAWDERTLDEAFVIVGKTQNLSGSPAARAIEAAAVQWLDNPNFPGLVFSDYLKGQVNVILAFADQIFSGDVKAQVQEDAISSLIRASAARQIEERAAQVGPGATHTADLRNNVERIYLTEEARDRAQAQAEFGANA